jgi:hypothetical protein
MAFKFKLDDVVLLLFIKCAQFELFFHKILSLFLVSNKQQNSMRQTASPQEVQSACLDCAKVMIEIDTTC